MLVIGHRGASGYAPENTFAAFERALELGADGIETDVRVTRDGVLVLLHDATVDRTTDGRGRISSLSWREVERLDAGSWFGTAFAGQCVPLVDELLDRYARRTQLVLELKTDRARPGLVNELRWRGLDREAGVHLISFSGRTARLAAADLPNIPTGRLSHSVWRGFTTRAAKAGLHEIWPHIRAIDPHLQYQTKAAGLFLGTWGIESKTDVRHALMYGRVDAITLDCPDWVLEAGAVSSRN